MEQRNIEGEYKICEGWIDFSFTYAIFDLLTAVGLNKEKSNLMEVLKELYLITYLAELKIDDIMELINSTNSTSENKFDFVTDEIEEKINEINRNSEKKIKFAQWDNFYSNRKKDIWVIIEGVTGEKRPKVNHYEFSLNEKVIFWEILMQKDRKLLNKLKNGDISKIDKEEMDVVAELLKLFEKEYIGEKKLDSEVVYNRIEKEFCKPYKQCMKSFEDLKVAVEKCKGLIDEDEKYINLLYDVAKDIDKIIVKINMTWIKERMELSMKKNNKEDNDN